MIVYKATNLLNGKIYIGKTNKNLDQYKLLHIKAALKNIDNKKRYFYNAIRKYGPQNFKWDILGYCESKEELNEAEKICIEFFKSNNNVYGYNMTYGGDGGPTNVGRKFSQEVRQRMSNSMKGKKHKPMTNDTKLKISKSHKGIPKSKEQILKRLKTIEKNGGYKHSIETKIKISNKVSGRNNGFYGKKHSKEVILKDVQRQKYNYNSLMELCLNEKYTLITSEKEYYQPKQKKIKLLCPKGHEYIVDLNAFVKSGHRCGHCYRGRNVLL